MWIKTSAINPHTSNNFEKNYGCGQEFNEMRLVDNERPIDGRGETTQIALSYHSDKALTKRRLQKL